MFPQSSFMGMPSHMVYQNPAVASSSQLQLQLPFMKWWPMYARALFILARSHKPSDTNSEQAMKVFMVNLADLLPNATYSQYMRDFLQLKPYVVDNLLRVVPNVFAAYPWLERMLRTEPKVFNDTAFKNQDGQILFLYVYLLNVFMLDMFNRANIRRKPEPILTLNDQRSLYQLDRISKSDWGNSIWFILHTSALYAPEPMDQSFVKYRTMMNSLRFLLPCPMCREHLTQNITKIDFVRCRKTREDLFRCSWQLHNIVNISEKKPPMGLQEAFALYSM